jgi:hypothetical protein
MRQQQLAAVLKAEAAIDHSSVAASTVAAVVEISSLLADVAVLHRRVITSYPYNSSYASVELSISC